MRGSADNSRASGFPARLREYWFAYALIFTFLFVTHLPLLRLPYFWDEAGYFIPAARDLLLTGSLVPHTTLSNAHPPLLMIWLAFWWKFSAFTPAVTRTSMLLVAAFALLGLWRLSRDVAGEAVAAATVLCTALYPVFFAQSSLAHLDMMAAALTLWGLAMYVERRPVATIVFLALAPLAKETAIIAPMALLAWELICPLLAEARQRISVPVPPEQAADLLVSAVPAAAGAVVSLSPSPHWLLPRQSAISALQPAGHRKSAAYCPRDADPAVACVGIPESLPADSGGSVRDGPPAVD